MSDVPWLALLCAVPALELWSRRRGASLVSLGTIAHRLWRHPLGRLGLLCLWAFVGVHLFSRDTLGA